MKKLTTDNKKLMKNVDKLMKDNKMFKQLLEMKKEKQQVIRTYFNKFHSILNH